MEKRKGDEELHRVPCFFSSSLGGLCHWWLPFSCSSPFVVEAAVAAQSVASLAALSDFLDFSKKPSSLLEKFLYAAAFSPRPSGQLLRLVLVSMGISLPAWESWVPGGSSPDFRQEGTASMFAGKRKIFYLEIHLPAYGIILCAFNGTLAMGVDVLGGKTFSRKCLISVH